MSSIAKSEVKVRTLHELGVCLDDLLDTAEKAELRLSGVPDWMRKAGAALLSVQVEVDAECGADTEQAQKLKDIVARAHAKLQAVCTQVENDYRVSAGRTMGLKISVEITKRAHDEAAVKLAKAVAAEAASVAAGTPSGGHSHQSIKQQRLAETVPAEKPATESSVVAAVSPATPAKSAKSTKKSHSKPASKKLAKKKPGNT